MSEDEERVLKALTKTPKKFRQVKIDADFRGWWAERRLDRTLQKLRRAKMAVYLKKAEGGPGWVLTQNMNTGVPR